MPGEAQMRRIVTPEQLMEGWVEFRANRIPNIIRHEYINAVPRRDGNYEVDDPRPAAVEESTEKEAENDVTK